MNWKHSANAGFFGLRRDRFVQYQPQRTLAEKIALVAQVKGLTGIELKHPGDFEDITPLKRLLEGHGLELSAVNVDTKDTAHFLHGALSARKIWVTPFRLEKSTIVWAASARSRSRDSLCSLRLNSRCFSIDSRTSGARRPKSAEGRTHTAKQSALR